jgi:hypothetical protein
MGDDDVIAYERNRRLHKEHMERIRNMKPVTDSKPPRSMGPSMIHLKTRPKKQQLIDDRRHMIAMENKKMMENMTKIMMAPKTEYRYVQPPSLNENERKMRVDLMNMDNRLLHERLTRVKSVIDRKELAESFRRHQEVRGHMGRKFMGGGNKKKGGSKIKDKGLHGKSMDVNSMFDSSQYTAGQATKISGVSGGESMGSALGSPIKSMAEFRKHVISKKQAESRGNFEGGDPYASNTLKPMNGASSTISFENVQTSNAFEMTHAPRQQTS